MEFFNRIVDFFNPQFILEFDNFLKVRRISRKAAKLINKNIGSDLFTTRFTPNLGFLIEDAMNSRRFSSIRSRTITINGVEYKSIMTPIKSKDQIVKKIKLQFVEE